MKFINNNSVIIINKSTLQNLGAYANVLVLISRAIAEKRAVIKGDDLFLATKDQTELEALIGNHYLGASYAQGILREDEKEAVLNELQAFVAQELEKRVHDILLNAVFGRREVMVIRSRRG